MKANLALQQKLIVMLPLMMLCMCLLQLHEIIQSCQEYKVEAQRIGDQQVQQLFDGVRTEVQHALDKTRRV